MHLLARLPVGPRALPDEAFMVEVRRGQHDSARLGRVSIITRLHVYDEFDFLLPGRTVRRDPTVAAGVHLQTLRCPERLAGRRGLVSLGLVLGEPELLGRGSAPEPGRDYTVEERRIATEALFALHDTFDDLRADIRNPSLNWHLQPSYRPSGSN